MKYFGKFKKVCRNYIDQDNSISFVNEYVQITKMILTNKNR